MANPARLLRIAGMIFILAATLVTWRLLDLQRSAQIQTLVQREIGFASDLLLRDLRSRYAAATHFAHLWERGTPPDAPQFQADVQEQMESTPGLHSISYANSDMILDYVAPIAFQDMEGRSILSSEARRIALATARETRRAIVSDPVDLMDGSGSGFLMYMPLFTDVAFEGVLILVFNAEHWMMHLYGAGKAAHVLPGFALDISMNGLPLYQSPDFASTSSTHATSVALNWQDTDLILAARPRPVYYADHWHWTPESLSAVVFLTLSAMAALVALVQRARFAETQAQEAALELMGVNANLREEAEVRRRAETAAKEARAATARFLATMSHEIRTPLNAIIGMFQLISVAGDLPEKQRKQANMGIEAARRLHRDLSNVLDVSRLDAGALRVRVEDSDLDALTSAWGSSLEAFVMRSEKPISCEIDIAGDLPDRARVDAAALTQVVNNLMDNAVKFTEAGTVTLQVCGRDDALQIRVADTGMGIEPERRNTVFQRFYQVEGGIERRFSGTGLGLSITRELVELMAGRIEMRPNTPRGTVFEVTMPGALTQIMALPAALSCDADRAIQL